MVTTFDGSTSEEETSGIESGHQNASVVQDDDVGSSASSAYAARLVQSAAKSLLDTSTSMVSDSESSVGEAPPNEATLKSLETETLPALPDEQDRKRFIGCLASILASSYDFEGVSFDEQEPEHVVPSFHFYDAEDDDSGDEDSVPYHIDDCNDGDESSSKDEGIDGDSPGHVKDHDIKDNAGNRNSWCADEAAGEETVSSSDGNEETDVNDHVELKGEKNVRQVHTSQSQPNLETGDENRIPLNSRMSASFSCDQDEVVPSASAPEQQEANDQQKQLKWMQPNALNLNSMLRKDKSTFERARNRHRRRRYDLFSNLLLSSADLLLLDRSQAKCFIPMLRALLSPQKKPVDEKESSTRGSPQKEMSRQSSADADYKSDEGTGERADLDNDSCAPASKAGDDDRYFLVRELGDSDIIRAFLESLSPGSGFRCLSLMLLQHLLHSEQGYDARVRHVFKKLGVIVLVHEMDREQYSFGPDGEKIQLLSNSELAQLAARKFEALEQGIAAKLIRLSEIQRSQEAEGGPRGANGSTASKRQLKRGISREQIVRGLKVGSAGLVAGTLFAVTGGLAAPGIAAGVAAIAGSAAATAAVVTLTSTVAVTTIFGVGGGGLAAYKMQRRTQGLTEFKFQKEKVPDQKSEGRLDPELFSTICISGWLTDLCDFQRPWGVSPTNPRISDRLELLERFYTVHKPDHVPKCGRILSDWKGEERKLWRLLKQKYGRDPDHLFPFDDRRNHGGFLTLEENEILDQLFVELGHLPRANRMRSAWKSRARSDKQKLRNDGEQSSHASLKSSRATSREDISASLGESFRESCSVSSFKDAAVVGDSMSSGFDNIDSSSANRAKESSEKESDLSKKLMTVWDYHATYGGELYTIKWESALLMELCDSVTDLAVEVVEKATQQILRTTVLAALVSAIAIPQMLLSTTNMIDGTWTLAIERADEAGKELAKSLLFSRAGHRPVTLVGFSMGARVIYSCLKELARYQEKWEDFREKRSKFERRKSTNTDESIDNEYSLAAHENAKALEGMREPASIIEDAILMGLPNHLSRPSWVACRQVVGGRLVNCYSRKDLVLLLMFRVKKMTSGLKAVCGACSIDVPGVENVNVTDLIPSHEDYCVAAGEVLRRVRHGQPIRSKPKLEKQQAAGSEDPPISVQIS